MSLSILNYINSKKENVLHLSVKIIPKSQNNEIIGKMEDDVWKIKIRAVPEKWKANKEIENFLKKELNVKSVEVVVGKISQRKVLRIVRSA